MPPLMRYGKNCYSTQSFKNFLTLLALFVFCLYIWVQNKAERSYLTVLFEIVHFLRFDCVACFTGLVFIMEKIDNVFVAEMDLSSDWNGAQMVNEFSDPMNLWSSSYLTKTMDMNFWRRGK